MFVDSFIKKHLVQFYVRKIILWFCGIFCSKIIAVIKVLLLYEINEKLFLFCYDLFQHRPNIVHLTLSVFHLMENVLHALLFWNGFRVRNNEEKSL